MLLQISRGKKTRQFSSHQQSALLSLIFGRSSSAATWTALTNQQIRNSNTQPCTLLGKVPTSSKQPCSKRPIQVSSSGIKPREAVLQQSCHTPHIAELILNISTLGPVQVEQFSSHKQSVLLSLIFGRSSCASGRIPELFDSWPLHAAANQSGNEA